MSSKDSVKTSSILDTDVVVTQQS